MQVHPYTFRNEDVYLAWTWMQDIYNEYDVFFQDVGIDGAFTDHPNTLYRCVACVATCEKTIYGFYGRWEGS